MTTKLLVLANIEVGLYMKLIFLFALQNICQEWYMTGNIL